LFVCNIVTDGWPQQETGPSDHQAKESDEDDPAELDEELREHVAVWLYDHESFQKCCHANRL